MNIDEMKDRIARAEEIQRYTENRCEALERENAGLKARLNAINLLTHELQKRSKLKTQQLTKAKKIVKDLLSLCEGETDSKLVFARAEQFLKNDGCPDVMCEDCTKEDCGIKKLGLVEVKK